MQRLEAPAIGQQASGQLIEQLGVTGTGTVRSKNIGRSDDAHAEVVVPKAIDQDARRERVFRTGDPLREVIEKKARPF